MPILYNGKDVTEQVANGSLDTKAVAAEMRQNGGIHVEGGGSEAALQLAADGIAAVFEKWLIEGPSIPIEESTSGL